MLHKRILILSSIGIATGFVTGIFGGGGGMILVPLLSLLPDIAEENLFPSSVSVILPVCIISIFMADPEKTVTLHQIVPYLLGSFLGGTAAGIWSKKIPVLWLHRALGILVLWGGVRYLCQTAS